MEPDSTSQKFLPSSSESYTDAGPGTRGSCSILLVAYGLAATKSDVEVGKGPLIKLLPVFGGSSIWLYPKNEGPRFGSPYDQDHGVFWSILGPSIYGNPHMSLVVTSGRATSSDGCFVGRGRRLCDMWQRRE